MQLILVSDTWLRGVTPSPSQQPHPTCHVQIQCVPPGLSQNPLSNNDKLSLITYRKVQLGHGKETKNVFYLGSMITTMFGTFYLLVLYSHHFW